MLEPLRALQAQGVGDGVSTRYHFSPVSAKATPFSEQDLELIADLVPADSRVLDLGCGNGELLAYLQHLWNPLVAAAKARGIRIVDVRDERAAVYMAHAHAELTGGLGVALYLGNISHRLFKDSLLFPLALQRARTLMAGGVTTLEVKSGYGLSLEHEARCLRVARRLGQALPLTVGVANIARFLPQLRAWPRCVVCWRPRPTPKSTSSSAGGWWPNSLRRAKRTEPAPADRARRDGRVAK